MGTEWGDSKRANIMLIASLFSLFGLILSLICLIGVSTDADTVMNTAWNIGETTGVDFYIGLNIVVLDSDSTTVKEEWSDIDCNIFESGSEICDSCSDAATGIISTVVISFLTAITTLQTDIQRSTRAGDLNCQKFMGMLTAALGMITTLYSLSSYVDSCSRELPDKTAEGENIDWVMGPGFSCLLVATMIKPIDFIAHAIVPVIKPEDDEGKNSL